MKQMLATMHSVFCNQLAHSNHETNSRISASGLCEQSRWFIYTDRPSVFAHCKWTKTGCWEGLWTRLLLPSFPFSLYIFHLSPLYLIPLLPATIISPLPPFSPWCHAFHYTWFAHSCFVYSSFVYPKFFLLQFCLLMFCLLIVYM